MQVDPIPNNWAPVDIMLLGRILGKQYVRQKFAGRSLQCSTGTIGKIDFHNKGQTAVLSAKVTPECSAEICVISCCGAHGTMWQQKGDNLCVALGERDVLIIPIPQATPLS
jgi:hypothetical protein